MKQYVTLDKRSKKAKKEYYSKQRLTWGVLNPVTRSVPSGKTYNRKKDKQERRRIGREFSNGFDADFYAGVGWFCNSLHNKMRKIENKIRNNCSCSVHKKKNWRRFYDSDFK